MICFGFTNAGMMNCIINRQYRYSGYIRYMYLGTNVRMSARGVTTPAKCYRTTGQYDQASTLYKLGQDTKTKKTLFDMYP